MADTASTADTHSTKRGARNSRSDLTRIQGAHDLMAELGATCSADNAPQPEPGEEQPGEQPGDMGVPMMSLAPDDAVVMYGDAVKSLGDGRVGGYLVRFGDATKTDLTGDFFTAETDFGPHETSLVFYHHGLDSTLKRRVIDKHATLRKDDVGVWVEAQLNLRDEYERAIHDDLVVPGKCGWSSGTAGHLMERESVGKAMWIKSWPLGLDASLTPTPAEVRNVAIPLKSLIGTISTPPTQGGAQPGQATPAAPDGAPAQAAPRAAGSSVPTHSTQTQEFDMDEIQLKALLDAALTPLVQKVAALEAEVKTPTLPPAAPIPDAGGTARPDVTATDRDPRPFKSLADQLYAVRAVENRNASAEQVNRLEGVRGHNLKATGASESVSSDGGFLVQTEFATNVFERIYQTGALLARCSEQVIGPQFSGMQIPAVDEQSRADGSRFGGIRAYWGSEAGTLQSSKPTWRQVRLELKKLHVLVYATDELLSDAAAFDSFLQRNVPNEIKFKWEDALYNGTGGGLPLGMLNAPCTVSVAKETGQAAATITWANVKKMWARLWAGGAGANVIQGNGGSMSGAAWFINQDCMPQLFSMTENVGTGGVPVFLPASGAAGLPYSTLMGRPVIPVEYAATVGTTGDIMLADMSQYVLATKGGIKGAMSIHVQFTTDEVAYRWTLRTDGQPLWNTALTPYKGSATQSPFVKLDTRA